jgi:2-methylcitrate dehydratase PrpD
VGSLSAALARHVAAFPVDALPVTAAHAASRAVLDGIGVMMAASGASADAQPFIALASRHRGAKEATILGFDRRTTAERAAFANGAMAHALDYEDAFDPAPCHPNASLIPAALAVAEREGGVSGRELLAAVAIGCDLACRLGLSLCRPMESGGWYPPPIIGAFGAVSAAARLLRLDQSQVTDAFSLMLCQATAPGEIRHSRNAVIRAVREAFPAQAAVVSADLARKGVRGFEAPFEGEGGFFRMFANGEYAPDALLHGLGERFWIEELSFKPWPACRGAHGAIEAALRLGAVPEFDWRKIGAVRLEGAPFQRMLVDPLDRKRAPATVIDAKFSLPFTVALALVHGRATLSDFDQGRLGDPEVRQLASRVSFGDRADLGPAAAAVTLEMLDGRTLHAEVAIPLGSPERPLDDAALRAKFIDCAAHAAAPLANPGAAADELLSIATVPDIRQLQCLGH